MKKALLLVVVIFSSFTFQAFSENVLVLTKSNSSERDILRRGSFLVFELKEDKSVREGIIRDIKDSSLVFDDAQVSLSQIHVLAGSTKSNVVAGKVAKAIGNALLLTSTVVFDCGLDIIYYNDYYYWPLGGTVWLAGAFIAGLGYAFDFATYPFERSVRVRNYREWNAAIVKEKEPASEKQISQPKDSTQIIPAPVPEKYKGKEKNKRKLSDDDVYGG